MRAGREPETPLLAAERPPPLPTPEGLLGCSLSEAQADASGQGSGRGPGPAPQGETGSGGCMCQACAGSISWEGEEEKRVSESRQEQNRRSSFSLTFFSRPLILPTPIGGIPGGPVEVWGNRPRNTASLMATPPPSSPCPRCGAATATTTTATTAVGDGDGGTASQPADDPAAPAPDSVAGGATTCTSCGFILDDAPLDGRPPARHGEDQGRRGAGGGGGANASGAGDGVFISGRAGARDAAGACGDG